MSAAISDHQHQCSCGRTFRHGISLKRHQKVSGCAALTDDIKAPVEDTRPITPTVSEPKLIQEKVSITTHSSPAQPSPITAQQIALWQQEKNPVPLTEPSITSWWDSIDHEAMREQFFNTLATCSHAASAFTQTLGSFISLGARFVLFGAFLCGLSWLCLFGISTKLSAAPTTVQDSAKLAQMAASSTVHGFLQTVRLGQYERAHDYLAPAIQSSVSVDKLRSLTGNLCSHLAAQDVSTTIDSQGHFATVTIFRRSQTETYTLIDNQGSWALSEIAVSHST